MTTAADLRLIERAVEIRTRAYAAHPDAEDIRQVARIAAWQGLEKRTFLAPGTVIGKAIGWAIGKYNEREAHPNYRRHDGRRQAGLRTVSLDDLVEEDGDLDETMFLAAADFAPDLINRLEAERIIDAALSRCTPLQRQAIIECCLGEKSVTQFARERGSSRTTVTELLQRGLAECRGTESS